MPRILITAFEPYDRWSENSSWLTLVEFTKDLEPRAKVTTRLYPVDYSLVRERLERDLAANYDYALHLGQSPGSAEVQLEAIGLNVGGHHEGDTESFHTLVADGPLAYRSALPLEKWAGVLRDADIPARVSHYAGTYLCNATLYLSHYFADRHGWRTQTTFVHVPIDPCQAAHQKEVIPCLPVTISAQALRLVVAELTRHAQLRDLELA
jgi:pyroglutamyl-peptidase